MSTAVAVKKKTFRDKRGHFISEEAYNLLMAPAPVVVVPEKRHKDMSQAEKVLTMLTQNKGIVPLKEIEKTLEGQVEGYRLPVYLWELKKVGAKIERKKEGRKVVSVHLLNPAEMEEYLTKRFPDQKF